MKRLNKEEMLLVNGDAEYYVSSGTCTGIFAAHKIGHSIDIEGRGTTIASARSDFNSQLITHKTSNQYRDHTHSLNLRKIM